MSQFQCPICGKFVSVRYYDPSDFDDDIFLVQVRGLGHGKGVEITETYSLLNGDNPELLELISDRIGVLYDLLYEDEDEEAEVDDDDEEEEYADIEESPSAVSALQTELERLIEDDEDEEAEVDDDDEDHGDAEEDDV